MHDCRSKNFNGMDLGERDEDEAKSFMLRRIRYRWGFACAREGARLLLVRIPLVGRPHYGGRSRVVVDHFDDTLGSAALFQDA